eukprot:132347-Prymnesium_polylepis.1
MRDGRVTVRLAEAAGTVVEDHIVGGAPTLHLPPSARRRTAAREQVVETLPRAQAVSNDEDASRDAPGPAARTVSPRADAILLVLRVGAVA